MTSPYFDIVRKIISEKTGADKGEIKEDSYFKEDLNISDLELEDIIGEVEEKLQVETLMPHETAIGDIEEDEEEYGEDIESLHIETVQDLLDVISEQLD